MSISFLSLFLHINEDDKLSFKRTVRSFVLELISNHWKFPLFEQKLKFIDMGLNFTSRKIR